MLTGDGLSVHLNSLGNRQCPVSIKASASVSYADDPSSILGRGSLIVGPFGSVVERHLGKMKVVGSIPTRGSVYFTGLV